MNRGFRCSARNTLLSAAGASWHRQGTRCQSSAGTCSVDQWHFFFFPKLKTGSGRPGINSLRGRLNPPPYIIRSKYVNPSAETQSHFKQISTVEKLKTNNQKKWSTLLPADCMNSAFVFEVFEGVSRDREADWSCPLILDSLTIGVKNTSKYKLSTKYSSQKLFRVLVTS